MEESIARIRIELRDLEPKIWRRVDVPATYSLQTLHEVIQVAFGWLDYHLFQFTVGKKRYGKPSPEYGDCVKMYDAKNLRLKALVERGIQQFSYLYDFGDRWHHDIIVCDVRAGAADIDYPAFVDGARRCPPEDVGGTPGFINFREAALDSTHPKHDEMLRWYGMPFDVDEIDERRVRTLLRCMAARRRGAVQRYFATSEAAARHS